MATLSKEEFIFKQMKKVFEICELPIGLERHKGGLNVSTGLFHPEGPYKEVLMASYSPTIHLVNINSVLATQPISQEKLPELLDLLNLINQSLVCAFLRFRPAMKKVEIIAGMFLAGGEFDGTQFKRLLEHVVDVGHKFYPILEDFLSGNTSKDTARQQIDQAWPHSPSE